MWLAALVVPGATFAVPGRVEVAIALAALGAVIALAGVAADLPPTSRTSIKFVKSVNQENDGHEEEQIYR
jgi:hypothetical protein